MPKVAIIGGGAAGMACAIAAAREGAEAHVYERADRVGKKLLVTLEQFSIIRLERDTQLLIPAYDYCMPDKACQGSSEDDPCSMFSRIHFPIDEFFPPDCITPDADYRSLL